MKQVKAIIRKAGENYEINLPESILNEYREANSKYGPFTDLEAGYGVAHEVATCQFNLTTEDTILDLGTSEAYEAIKVTVEVIPEVEPPPEPQDDHNGEYFHPYQMITCNYLGVKLTIRGLDARYQGQLYFLPMELKTKGGEWKPLDEGLSRNKLGQVLIQDPHIRNKGYRIVVPHTQLPNYEEAEDFLRDMVDEETKEKEAAAEVKNKTAKAWQGWRNDEQGPKE